jgi:hypothetical protein
MHEISHIVGQHQHSRDTLVRERWAWKWARENALEWTAAEDRQAEKALTTHEVARIAQLLEQEQRRYDREVFKWEREHGRP